MPFVAVAAKGGGCVVPRASGESELDSGEVSMRRLFTAVVVGVLAALTLSPSAQAAPAAPPRGSGWVRIRS